MRLQVEFMFDPFIRTSPRLHLDSPECLSGYVRPQRSSEVSMVVAANPESAVVLLDFDVHAPVTIIEEAKLSLLPTGGRHIH